MTSGSLRVPDSEADKFASILLEIASTSAEGWEEQTDYARHILRLLEEKGEFGEDSPALRQLKGLILRGELRDAAHALGLGQENITFLDLPFYETGRYRRFRTSGRGRQRRRANCSTTSSRTRSTPPATPPIPRPSARSASASSNRRSSSASRRTGPPPAACGSIAARKKRWTRTRSTWPCR